MAKVIEKERKEKKKINRKKKGHFSRKEEMDDCGKEDKTITCDMTSLA
jgi:hypothetical protein